VEERVTGSFAAGSAGYQDEHPDVADRSVGDLLGKVTTDLSTLRRFVGFGFVFLIANSGITIVVLAVPASAAQEVCNRLVRAGDVREGDRRLVAHEHSRLALAKGQRLIVASLGLAHHEEQDRPKEHQR